MTKRIVYIKNQDGSLKSKGEIRNKFGHGFVVAVISTGRAAVITSSDSTITQLTLTATSFHKIKIKIKKTLTELGCEFEPEVRKPRK
jgi:hypothetical protein